MNTTLKVIVFGLGLLFGIDAFAICMHTGYNLATAALHASGWWATFSISHVLIYLVLK